MSNYIDRQINVALDLLNSYDPILDEPEHLRSPADIGELLQRHGFDAGDQPTTAHLRAARQLRARLREIVGADDDVAAERRLNDLLSGVAALPVVVNDDGDWRVELRVSPRLPLTGLLSSTAILGLAAAYQRHGRDRIHVCAADPCQDVFIDLSRNRSRRFCSDRCASRHNVAAFRERARSRE